VLRLFHTLGVRYMTLTHFLNNNWADSSTDKPKHNGLTAFGKDVVREMNRLGMMVDISHVSDKTFYDAVALTKAPVIASHSSVRAICAHRRNMNDEMLRAVAKNGGVVMINYEISFLSEEYRKAVDIQDMTIIERQFAEKCGTNLSCMILTGNREARRRMMAGELPKVNWEKIIEHIEHVVRVAGVDHVGLGSDFDGATMPFGMDDASMLPRITDTLLKKGYSEADVEKILGGNLLRVMERVEQVSREMKVQAGGGL
jgi:membrane dipeptidase